MTKSKYFFSISTVLFLIILLNYANSLHSPFHYDDEILVKHNTSIKNINNYFQLKRIVYRHTLHLTYSLNYFWGELNPFGYHLLNILLHFFTSITIFFITFITMEKGVLWRRDAALKIAFITASFFSLNPVHSETVTYISGRSSGLASFLYFVSLLLFIIGSLKHIGIKIPRQLLYLFSFATGLLALTSKEISVTLPAAIILYDLCFMRSKSWVKFRTRLLYYYLPLPILAAAALTKYLSTLLITINSFLNKADILNALVQFKIINYVIKLYFFPINLVFDYHFPNFFHSKELTFLPVVVVFVFALLYALKRIHKINPVLSFSILWYLITISPTNSILPRAELFNERNFYLPSFGLSLFFATGIFFLFQYYRKYSTRFLFSLGSLLIILTLNSALLIKRNNIYKTEIYLWEDTLKKSPRKARAFNNLGRAYLSNGEYEKARKVLNQLSASNPFDYYAHINLGKLYADTGDLESAKIEFEEAVKVNPKLPEAYINLGVYYASKGDFLNAKKVFSKANKYHYYYKHPDYYLNKAKIGFALNHLNDAEKAVKEFLKLFPGIPKAYFLLGQIYNRKGKKNLAIEEYRKSKGDKYFEAIAHNNIGLIYIEQNKFDEAIVELIKAISINPSLLEAQFNLGKLFMEIKGDNKKARVHLKKALELKPGHKKAGIIKKMLVQLND